MYVALIDSLRCKYMRHPPSEKKIPPKTMEIATISQN
jgi:hypothetical protein